jgi:hypothetical protein
VFFDGVDDGSAVNKRGVNQSGSASSDIDAFSSTFARFPPACFHGSRCQIVQSLLVGGLRCDLTSSRRW